MSLLELLLLANIKNICRNTVAREGSRGGKSNKAIADYFIPLPMCHITGEGKGKGRRGMGCEGLLGQSRQPMEGNIPSSRSPSGCSVLDFRWV